MSGEVATAKHKSNRDNDRISRKRFDQVNAYKTILYTLETLEDSPSLRKT